MELLTGKTEYALSLFRFFIEEYKQIGPIELISLKSMIALKGHQKIAYVTQIGKNFVHIVFPFNQIYHDNLCFSKIANVPGTEQYNHHLRIYDVADVNDEVKAFMKMAYFAS